MSKNYLEEIKNFHVIGISYEKADVDTRGQFTFFSDWTASFCDKAKNIDINHFFILSTCNRTEIYFFGDSPEKIMEIYCEQVNGDLEVFKEITFVKKGKDALRHLFRVSTGIESQILGDFEVLYQMKKAFVQFKEYGCSNAYLERFMSTAIQISKQIKNETSLSDGATSVSYAAVQYILEHIQDLEHKKMVLFGTGKIGRNTCENLVKHTVNNNVTLINRTHEKAVTLSDKLNLSTRKIEELEKVLEDTDILIVATGAKTPTITKSMLTNREMLIIDLSIPENIAEDVRDLNKITVVNVDELSKVINKTFASRTYEIPKVETIIRLNMWEFEDWLDSRKYVPAIESFKKRMEFLKSHEKKQLAKKNMPLNGKDPLSERLIRKMTNQFAAHLMTHPENAEETIKLMNSIFHLDLKK